MSEETQVKVLDQKRPLDALDESEITRLRNMTVVERKKEAEASRQAADAILEQCREDDPLAAEGYRYEFLQATDVKNPENKKDLYPEYQKHAAAISHIAYMNGKSNESRQLELAVQQHVPGKASDDFVAGYDRPDNSIDGLLGFIESRVDGMPKASEHANLFSEPRLFQTDEGVNFRDVQELVRQASGFYNALNVTGRGSTGATQFSQPAGGSNNTEQPGIDVDRPRLNIPVQEVLKLRDMLVTRISVYDCPPNTDTYKYLVEDPGNDNGGAEDSNVTGVAEGAKYPLQDVRAIDKSVTIKKIGIMSSITRELLSDVMQARGFWNRSLMRRWFEYYENQALNGDGSENAMTGWLNAATGKLSHDRAAANNYRSVLGDYLKAYSIFTTARNDATTPGANKEPDLIVMKPKEKARLMAAVDSQDRFLWGDPHAAGFTNVWGVPITTSDFVAANTALMLATEDLGIVVKDGLDVEYGLAFEDFERDRRSVKMSMRANAIVFRDKSILQITNLNRPFDTDGTQPAI